MRYYYGLYFERLDLCGLGISYVSFQMVLIPWCTLLQCIMVDNWSKFYGRNNINYYDVKLVLRFL